MDEKYVNKYSANKKYGIINLVNKAIKRPRKDKHPEIKRSGEADIRDLNNMLVSSDKKFGGVAIAKVGENLERATGNWNGKLFLTKEPVKVEEVNQEPKMIKEYPPISETLLKLWEEKYGLEIKNILKKSGNRAIKIETLILENKEEKNIFKVYFESNEFGSVTIAKFACTPMSGCYAIVLFHSTAVNDLVRGLGIASVLQRLRLESAKVSGFSYAQCTTNSKNDVQNKLLTKFGWEPIKKFNNIKTGNEVIYWMKEIER